MPSATKSKDLRSGQAVWREYPTPRVRSEILQRNLKADVIVVGAGISGAMIADELSACGFSVAVLDKRKPLKGSTAASTALLLYEIDTPVLRLQKKIGAQKAIQAWRRSKLGLHALEEKIEKLKLRCSAERHGSLYLAGTEMNSQNLQQECDLRNAAGFVTRFLSEKELKGNFGISRRGALQSFSSLSVNPVQLTAGFLNSALERKCKIYSAVTVEDFEESTNGVRVYTEQGLTLRAQHLVFATGYEMPKQAQTRKHKIHSTWVFATKPQKKLWPEQSFIWEASDPYLYVRSTEDKRVICGGEDEEFSDDEKRDALTGQKIKTLQKKLTHLFPYLDVEAEYTWSGAFGSSTTGLPSIGLIPGMKKCYAVLGYGGNGITFSRIAAELIRAKITGIKDPDEELFDF